MANTAAGGEATWLRNYGEWLEVCRAKHGNRYGYSPERVSVGGVWKVRIMCPEHGEFLQAPSKHRAGQGCPVCAGNVAFNVRERLVVTFPTQVFPEVLPASTKERFVLECPEHGPFRTHLNQLLASKAKLGVACPKCNVLARGLKCRSSNTMNRLRARWPEYTFADVGAIRMVDKIAYTCPSHGEFESTVADMIGGHGCPRCGDEARRTGIIDVLGMTLRQNAIDVGRVHGGSVIVHASTINGTQNKVRVTCVKHGAFETRLYSLKAGHGCPKCSHHVSKGEAEMVEWLRTLPLADDISVQRRDLLEKGELDIVVGSVAIEYCGLYWHSEEHRGRGEHARKAKDAGKAGIRLLTVFEDEWIERKDAVKATIMTMVGVAPRGVAARTTVVRAAAWSEVSGLYERHHLQGAGSPCAENYVLEYGGDVVAAMSFKPDRFGGYNKELVRYVSSVRVVGGFSKLLKQFRLNNPKGTTLVSYCDLRWFSGEVYRKAGFSFVAQTQPGYWWCKGSKRYSRFMFQKHRLSEKLKNFDAEKTEEQNMVANGYWKVYDCGMGKWEMRL